MSVQWISKLRQQSPALEYSGDCVSCCLGLQGSQMEPMMFHTTDAKSGKSMLKHHKKVLKVLPCQKEQPV